jgi:hypothetical protein
MSDSEIVLLACLAQNGNPITFSAVGGGSLKLDFDDSQIPAAAALLALRDMPLQIVIRVASEGELVQRRGGKRAGAGRPVGEA